MSDDVRSADENEEIEVTLEMVRAGGRVYLRENSDSWDEHVAKIYRAMERARRAAEREVT